MAPVAGSAPSPGGGAFSFPRIEVVMSRAACRRVGLAVLLAVFSSYATAFAAKTLAVKGGLSVASVAQGSDFYDLESKKGFTGAVAMELPLTGRLSIAPELGYAMRGYSFGEDDNLSIGTVEFLQHTEYLTVAAPFSIAFPAGQFGFALSSGPQVGLKTREIFASRGSFDDTFSTKNLKDTDFDWLFGVGVDVGMGRARLGIEGRYVLGLIDINQPRMETAAPIGSDEPSFKNRSFEIMATWKYSLGH